MPFTAPNDTPIVIRPIFKDKWGREIDLPEGSKVQWAPGETTIGSLVVAPDTLSAHVVPLATAEGDYVYSYTVSVGNNSISGGDSIQFETPFAMSATTHMSVSQVSLGEK